jgi:hypothetical protein
MSSLSPKDRVSLCSFSFADGRRCRTPRARNNSRFCAYHAEKEARARTAQNLGKDLAYFSPATTSRPVISAAPWRASSRRSAGPGRSELVPTRSGDRSESGSSTRPGHATCPRPNPLANPNASSANSGAVPVSICIPRPTNTRFSLSSGLSTGAQRKILPHSRHSQHGRDATDSRNAIRWAARANRSAGQPIGYSPIHSPTCPKQGPLRAPLRPQLPPPHRRQTLLNQHLHNHLATVDSKPLTPTLTLLSATLTKNVGGGSRYG